MFHSGGCVIQLEIVFEARDERHAHHIQRELKRAGIHAIVWGDISSKLSRPTPISATSIGVPNEVAERVRRMIEDIESNAHT